MDGQSHGIGKSPGQTGETRVRASHASGAVLWENFIGYFE